MLEYLPIYIIYDLELPNHYELPIESFNWTLNKIHFRNVQYDLIYMDLMQFKFEFTKYEYEQVIWITFPFLEGWRLIADW